MSADAQRGELDVEARGPYDPEEGMDRGERHVEGDVIAVGKGPEGEGEKVGEVRDCQEDYPGDNG